MSTGCQYIGLVTNLEIHSTLLAQQANFAVVHHATMMALSYLK